MKKIFVTISIVLILGIVGSLPVIAQTNLTGLGIAVSIKDQNAQNGDIICSTKDGYALCSGEYDSSVYGVINDSPSLDVTLGNLTNGHKVISKGETTVRVSSINGNIKTGDFITTSKTPGVGELVTKTGYVVGRALADYSSGDKNAVGQIAVALDPHAQISAASTARQNIIEILRNGLTGLGVDPISALRYVLASAMVLVSFAIGFIYFGRIAKSGVEAIGRNPLAGVRIQASVVVNILVLLAVVAAGLIVAYLILAI